MPYGNVTILDRIEAKIEAVRGTAEATMTRPVVFPLGRATWTWEADEGLVPESLRSFHASDADFTSVGIATSRINIEAILSFEEAIWWLNLAVDGNSRTGVTTGSTPAGYTYTQTPSSAVDDLDTITLKCGDGAVAYKFDRGVVNTATLRWNPARGGDSYWMISVEIFARFLGTTTFDAPAALVRHKIAAKGTKVYLDAFGGTIGTTQATGVIRSGSITINNQIEEKQWSEDDTNVGSDFGRGEQVITVEVVRELNADTEFALLRAGTTRKLRIEKVGDAIGTTPTTNFQWRIDMPVFRYTPRMAPNYQGQNRIVTMAGRALRNSVSAVPITFATVISAATVTA